MTFDEIKEQINDCIRIEEKYQDKRIDLENQLSKYRFKLIEKFNNKYIKINTKLSVLRDDYLYGYVSTKGMLVDDDLVLNVIIINGNKVFYEKDYYVEIENLIYAKEITKQEFDKQVDLYLEYCKNNVKQLKEKH